MDIQEISDRMEINEILVAYATAIDSKQYEQLRSVFSEDAAIDFTAVGGPSGNLDTIMSYLEEALKVFPHTQHMLGNSAVQVDGDKATSKTMCHNPMMLRNDEGNDETFFIGLWYIDDLVKTSLGWRIQTREIELCYVYDQPNQLNITNQ